MSKELFFGCVLMLATVALLVGVTESIARILLFRSTPDAMVFSPEYVYSYRPESQVNGVHLNNAGCIGDDFVREHSKRVSHVLLLGGSTSFAPFYVRQVKRTLQSLAPNITWKVSSCGRPRYTSAISAQLLDSVLASYSIDAIAVYHGINDNIYNTFSWSSRIPSIGFFDWQDTHKLLSYELAKYHIVDKLILSTPVFETAPLRSEAVFRDSLRRIAHRAQAMGAAIVFKTFEVALPTTDVSLSRKIQSEESTMQHFWGTIDSTLFGVRRHNELLRKEAAFTGAFLADHSEQLNKSGQDFIDICHMTPEGQKKLGHSVGLAVFHALSTNEGTPAL